MRRTEPSFESDAWNAYESAYVGVCDSQFLNDKKSISMCFFPFSLLFHLATAFFIRL